MDELKLKIGAVDDTQKAFDSASQRANKFKDVINSFKKDGKLMPELSDRSVMERSLKQMRDGFNKIHQDKNKQNNKDKIHKRNIHSMDRNQMSRSLDQAEQIGSAITTGRETEVLAQKVGDIGKGMMSKAELSSVVSPSGKSGAGKEIVDSAKEFKKTISSAAKDVAKGLGTGYTSTASGGFRFTYGGRSAAAPPAGRSGAPDPANETANQVSGLSKMLGPLGFATAGIAASYKIASAMSGAFRNQANQQIGNLQRLGTLAGPKYNKAGRRVDTGFFSGYEDIGITGGQRTGLMAAYGAQTMGRTGAKYTGQTRQMAEVMAAYGLGAGQVGGMAGTMARYKRGGDVSGLMTAIGAAEKAGMGGARLPEFLSSLEGSIADAVQSGSSVGNDELVETLGMMSRTDDERIKTIAPNIMKSASGVFRSAAGLKGGAGESFAMQAVWSQMKKDAKGGPVSLFDVRERLSKGGTVDNLKAIVDESQRLFPGNKEMSTFMLQQSGMLGNITSPAMAQQVVDMISAYDDKGKSTGGGGSRQQLMKELENMGVSATGKRIGALQPGIEKSLGRAVKDGNAALIKVNEQAAQATDALKDTMQNLIKTITGGKASEEATAEKLKTGSTKKGRKR